MDASASLPRPQHVILGHVFMQKGANAQVLVMGSTLRYKSKYVTCVIYKPAQSQTRWCSAMAQTMRMQENEREMMEGSPGSESEESLCVRKFLRKKRHVRENSTLCIMDSRNLRRRFAREGTRDNGTGPPRCR